MKILYKMDGDEQKLHEDKQPMCSIAKWIDPGTFEEKYTVLVVLPSGITNG